MFDSKISAKELVEDLKSEIDIAYDIPNRTYVSWINSTEQLLYSEIIKEHSGYIQADHGNNSVKLDEITPSGQDTVRFEDIYTVFAQLTGGKNVQLIKTTRVSGNIFPNCYYKENNNLVTRTIDTVEAISFEYYVRPALKTVDSSGNIGRGNIMLPPEFVDIIRTKIRGEACKIANEDAMAAKWLNDYNVLLETFKTWVQSRTPQFGM